MRDAGGGGGVAGNAEERHEPSRGSAGGVRRDPGTKSRKLQGFGRALAPCACWKIPRWGRGAAEFQLPRRCRTLMTLRAVQRPPRGARTWRSFKALAVALTLRLANSFGVAAWPSPVCPPCDPAGAPCLPAMSGRSSAAIMDRPFDRPLRLSNGQTVVTVASISEAGAFCCRTGHRRRRRRASIARRSRPACGRSPARSSRRWHGRRFCWRSRIWRVRGPVRTSADLKGANRPRQASGSAFSPKIREAQRGSGWEDVLPLLPGCQRGS